MISDHTKGPLTVKPNVHGTLMVFAGNGSNEPFTEVAQPMDYYGRQEVLKERANLFAAALEMFETLEWLAGLSFMEEPALTEVNKIIAKVRGQE